MTSEPMREPLGLLRHADLCVSGDYMEAFELGETYSDNAMSRNKDIKILRVI